MNAAQHIRRLADADGMLAQCKWWDWRQKFLQAKREPARAAALIAEIASEDYTLFETYWVSQCTGARLRDTQKANELIEQETLARLVAEAEGHGSPYPDGGFAPLESGEDGYVIVRPRPASDPRETYSVPGRTFNVHELSTRTRLLVIAALCVVAVVLIRLFFTTGEPTATAQTRPSAAPGASATPTPSMASAIAPVSVLDAEQRRTDPVSLKLGDAVYEVRPASVDARGYWVVQPKSSGASWLATTRARPVLCVDALDPASVQSIQLWTRGGAIVTFEDIHHLEVRDYQTDVFRPHTVGITVLECRGTNGVRDALTATHQRP